MNLSSSDFVEIAISSKYTKSSHNVSLKKPAEPIRLDVNFTLNTQETLALDTIVFQNYYVSSLSVSQPLGNTDAYNVILEGKCLMDNAYTEAGAQSWHSIHVSEFQSYDKSKPLRFTLIQPCSTWNTIELLNFKAYGKTISFSKKKEAEKTEYVSNDSIKDSISELLKEDYRILGEAVITQARIKENGMEEYETVTKSSKVSKKEKKSKKEIKDI